MIKGVDLSYWNGNLNMKCLKDAGIEFIIARSSYRTAEDTQFANYVRNARAEGITVLGGYHFLYLDNGGTIANNAAKFVDVMSRNGLSNAYYFIDVEYHLFEKLGTSITAEKVNSYTLDFINALIKLGVKKEQIVVYTNIDFYNSYYNDTVKSYPIWLADYEGEPNYECVIQQYSSEGKIDGCNCNFDMNYLYDSDMLQFKLSEVQKVGITAEQILNTARGWLGWSEANGKWWNIVDGVYNNYIRTHKGTGRGYCLTKNDEWCDSFVSSCFIKNNAESIVGGVECGVGAHILLFQAAGIWYGRSHTPAPGDIITFDWQNGAGSGSVWVSDHIGLVESFNASTGVVTTIEGNYGENVQRRNIAWNAASIYGYARPKYDATAPVTPTKPAEPVTDSHAVKYTVYICKACNPKTWYSDSASDMKTVPHAAINDKVDVCAGFDNMGDWLYVRFDKTNTYGFVKADCVSKAKTEEKKPAEVVTNDKLKTTSTSRFAISGTGTPNRTQVRVGKVTADVLNVRTWNSTDYNNIKSYPYLYEGNLVSVCDALYNSKNELWYYIKINENGGVYGFVHAGWVELQ